MSNSTSSNNNDNNTTGSTIVCTLPSNAGYDSGAGLYHTTFLQDVPYQKPPDSSSSSLIVVPTPLPTLQQINDFLQAKSDATRVLTPEGYIFREVFNPDYDDGFKQAIEMYSQSFFQPTEPAGKDIHRLSNKGFYRVMLMEDENKLVLACAFIVEVHECKSYYMDYLCVRPGVRGGGLGGKFFNQLTTHLRNEQKYLIITFESEPKLVPWYLRMSCLQLGVISDEVTYENGEHFFWWLMVCPLGSIEDNSDSDTDSEHDAQPLVVANNNGSTTTTLSSLPSVYVPNYHDSASTIAMSSCKSYILYNQTGSVFKLDQPILGRIAQYLLTFMSNAKK